MISIIIPTQNRCDLLSITLNKLLVLYNSFPNHEILIIDNASTDNTKENSLTLIQQNHGKEIRYIFEPIHGLQSGRQRGVVESKGDILVFIDDDIIPHPDWLSAIENSFIDETVHLVGGKCIPKFEIEPPYWTEYLWSIENEFKMCGPYSLIDQGDKIKVTDPTFIFGLNFSIRKKTLIDLGGFNPDIVPKNFQRFQGDGETGLALKIKSKGLKAIYNPNASVEHWVTKERMTFEYLEKRMFYQGVCDSYTKLRELSKREKCKSDNNLTVLRKQCGLGNKIIRRILARDLKEKINHLENEITEIKNTMNLVNLNPLKIELFERMRISHLRGYEFHQSEAKKSARLMEWILKEDYFDFDYTKYLD